MPSNQSDITTESPVSGERFRRLLVSFFSSTTIFAPVAVRYFGAVRSAMRYSSSGSANTVLGFAGSSISRRFHHAADLTLLKEYSPDESIVSVLDCAMNLITS